MSPAPVNGSIPKDNTPIPSVVPGGAPLPSANTKSVVFKSDGLSSKGKETQPLQIPEGVQWSDPVQVKPSAKPGWSSGQKAIVTLVLDGDTAKLTPEKGKDIMCRLDKIDAPETGKNGKPGQAYGEESKMNLKRLIDQKEVSVSVRKTKDAYDRELCQIEIDGVDVSLKQLQDGAAWLYKRFGNSVEERQAEAGAMANGIGLFKDKKAIHPRYFKHPN